MFLTIVVLLGCAAMIYLACEWFINAVEWLGVRMAVGSAVVATVLAAAGTALPESVVTLVAVLFGSQESGADVGVGSALGGPLVVGSLAYATAGVVLLGVQRSQRRRHSLAAAALARAGSTRQRALRAVDAPTPGQVVDRAGWPATTSTYSATQLSVVNMRAMARDQAWFLVPFAVATGVGLVAFSVKPLLGWALFAVYALYCWRQVRTGGQVHADEDLDALKLQPRRDQPATWAVIAQVVVSLVVIFAASQVFVGQLETLAPQLGLSASLVALLLAPIATELPEMLNAVIWVRKGKTALALGNLAGSMVIQATIPTGLAIAFTSWQVQGPLLLAALATVACAAYLLLMFATGKVSAGRLAVAGGFYATFAAALVVTT